MKNKIKQTGVILAAGLGTRLCDFQSGLKAKPLAALDELTLLLRALHSHEVACRDRVIIVVGWQAEAVESHVRTRYKGPLELVFAYNEYYHLQNGISLLKAGPFVGEEFVLTMADHVIDDSIMKLLMARRPPSDGAILCVDYKIKTVFDLDDATKVFTAGNRILKIGKKIKEYNCIDTGVFLCTQGLMTAISNIYRDKGDASVSDGILSLAESGRAEALDIKDCFWQDVDTPEMLMHARQLLSKHPKKISSSLSIMAG